MNSNEMTQINTLFQSHIEPLREDVGKLFEELSANRERIATVEEKTKAADCSGHETNLEAIKTDVHHAHGGVIRNRYWIFISLITILGALVGVLVYSPK